MSSASPSAEPFEPEDRFDSPEAIRRRSRARRSRRWSAIVVGAMVVVVVIIVTTAYEVGLQPPKTGVPTGTFQIRISCNHSVVTAKSSVLCSESNDTSVTLNSTGFDSCAGSSCRLNITDGTTNGYIFSNWTASGDAFFGTSGSGCSDSQISRSYSITLCMTASGSSTQYNGSVDANVV